ncbi:MAG: guanylate kinase, partial [Nitrososphaeraceae archaeon]|nr:guanylate kinase [Nitrososphaeraceae archaeon]
SGSGKTSIVKQVLKKFPELKFSISATTRPKRENEINGVEYIFITESEFKKKIEQNEFVEWEKFYDYYYGTFKDSINDNINNGISVLLEVDVKGALSLKKIYPESHLIYIMPPSYEELVKRLKERNTESEKDFKKRIERAKMELSEKDKFDYLILNENLNNAVKETLTLIKNILSKEN